MPRDKYYSHSAPEAFELFWDAESKEYPGGPGFHHPGKLDPAIVDEGIRDLVLKINNSGVMTTVSACEGHPERDEHSVFHVELWIHVPKADGLKRLHDWVEKAVRRRKELGGYTRERVIRLEFVGLTQFGYYFVIYGDFLSIPENKRIIRALTETF